MNAWENVLFWFAIVAGLYGLAQMVREKYVLSGVALIITGAVLGEWSGDHILTTPSEFVSWATWLLYITMTFLPIVMGAVILLFFSQESKE